MAITALTLAATRTITSKFDTAIDEDDKSKFEIGTLDSRIAGLLRDKGTTIVVNPNAPDEEVDSKINMNAVHHEACVFGLKGWENVTDENGEPLEYKTAKRNKGGTSYVVCDPECLKRIPNAVIQEIGAEILKENDLSDQEGNV